MKIQKNISPAQTDNTHVIAAGSPVSAECDIFNVILDISL